MRFANIYTPRLIIEALTEDHSTFMLELVNSPGWLQFIGDRNVHTEQDAITYIQRIHNNPKVTYYVARLKEGDAAIGIITFIKRDYLPYADIGFAFLPAAEGWGYAREAANAVLKQILTDYSEPHVLATTLQNNIRSIALLNKLGFDYDYTIQVDETNLLVYTANSIKLKG